MPYNVGKTIISHPPIITIFMGGMITIPNHIFVVKKIIVLPTSTWRFIAGKPWELIGSTSDTGGKGGGGQTAA